MEIGGGGGGGGEVGSGTGAMTTWVAAHAVNPPNAPVGNVDENELNDREKLVCISTSLPSSVGIFEENAFVRRNNAELIFSSLPNSGGRGG